MEHYDMRVIADCVVYSYEVPGPAKREEKSLPAKKSIAKKPVSRTSRRRAHQAAALRSVLLRVLFVLLAPFALLVDGLMACIRASLRAVCIFLRRPARGIPALGAFSFIAVIFSHFQGL